MTTWDEQIFTIDTNADFLDEISDLDTDEIVEAVRDAVLLAANGDSASEDEILNGQAAATIAAIWSGAPFSAGDVAEAYPVHPSAPGRDRREARRGCCCGAGSSGDRGGP